MILKEAFVETAKMPMTLSVNLGGFVLDALGRGDHVTRIMEEEPRSRATTALRSAQRAIQRSDQDLARFEVQRAAGAVRQLEPWEISQLGPRVIATMMELSTDDPLNSRILENVTEIMHTDGL